MRNKAQNKCQFDCNAKAKKPVSIRGRYQRIAASDAFKEAYVDRDIGETIEIKEDTV